MGESSKREGVQRSVQEKTLGGIGVVGTGYVEVEVATRVIN